VIGAHAGDDLVADLPHRRCVVAKQRGLHFFLPGRSALLPVAHERDFAAHVLAQQLVRFEQVVLVVLFEHLDPCRVGERSKVNGCRVYRRGDVHEAQVAGAARELQVAHVAHQRDVGVVDREGELRLIVEGRRQVLLIATRHGSFVSHLRAGQQGGLGLGTEQQRATQDGQRGEIRACRHGNRSLRTGRSWPFPLERSYKKFLQPAPGPAGVFGSEPASVDRRDHRPPFVGCRNCREINGFRKGNPRVGLTIGGKVDHTAAAHQPDDVGRWA
jgi:hypothetical protein